MDIKISDVLNVLAEAVVQRKIKEDAEMAIAVITIGGRKYQLQAKLEPILAKHLPEGSIISEGKVVVKSTTELFPELMGEPSEEQPKPKAPESPTDKVEAGTPPRGMKIVK